jgi:hypothetical protein
MNPRAGLDDVEKRKFLTLSRLELRPIRRTARGQSLSQGSVNKCHSFLHHTSRAVHARGLYKAKCPKHKMFKNTVRNTLYNQSSSNTDEFKQPSVAFCRFANCSILLCLRLLPTYACLCDEAAHPQSESHSRQLLKGWKL